MTGDQIAALRKRAGLSVVELADLCAVHRGTVYRWEDHCETNPPLCPGSHRVLYALRVVMARDRDGGARADAAADRLRRSFGEREKNGALWPLHVLLREFYA